ncbi:MAG: S8 family serine peptidase [Coprobacter sp.]
MNKARTETLVDNVQSGKDLTTPFLGKDVVIGIVDNGFEYGHINFYNTDGTELRVKRVWNQNKNGKAPSGFTYGTEYTTTDEILAAKYDVTDETHATHVTGIAAGADHTKSYYGVAGEADIVLVSYDLNDNTTDQVSLSDAMKYIYANR